MKLKSKMIPFCFILLSLYSVWQGETLLSTALSTLVIFLEIIKNANDNVARCNGIRKIENKDKNHVLGLFIVMIFSKG